MIFTGSVLAGARSVRPQRGRTRAYGGAVEGADLPGGDGVRDEPQSSDGTSDVRERRLPVDTDRGRVFVSRLFEDASRLSDLYRINISRESKGE